MQQFPKFVSQQILQIVGHADNSSDLRHRSPSRALIFAKSGKDLVKLSDNRKSDPNFKPENWFRNKGLNIQGSRLKATLLLTILINGLAVEKINEIFSRRKVRWNMIGF